MSKSTPGPWKINGNDTVVGINGNVVAECCGYSDKATDPAQIAQGSREANARLIAAAPEMLEALKELLLRSKQLDQSPTHDGLENCDSLAKARGAISRAEGKEN